MKLHVQRVLQIHVIIILNEKKSYTRIQSIIIKILYIIIIGTLCTGCINHWVSLMQLRQDVFESHPYVSRCSIHVVSQQVGLVQGYFCRDDYVKQCIVL